MNKPLWFAPRLLDILKKEGVGVFQVSLSSLSIISKAFVERYDYTIPENSCAGAKTIPERAFVNTQER